MKIKLLFLMLLSFSMLYVRAQVAVSYYPFRSVLSISSNTENMLWGDLRFETNTFFGNINMEPHVLINLKRSAWVNYYSGIGVNINPFNSASNISILNGYTVDFGVRIKPIQSHPNIQVLFEISPYINKQFDGGILRTFLGIGYNFRKGKSVNSKK